MHAPSLTAPNPDAPANAAELAAGLKDAFRTHPAGIALITAQTPAGPVGLTASSVASVGLDPAALAFSVTRATGSAGGLLQASSYLVHLLDEPQLGIAQQFAVTGGERFTEEQGWEYLESGEPFLPGTRAALRCRTLQSVGVGASTLVVAEVLDVRLGAPAAPLIYRDRAFHALGSAL